MRRTSLFLALGLAYAFCMIALGRVSAVYFDAEQYFAYAKNLAETGVYGVIPGVPDMHREPGYGVFLSALFALVRLLGLTPDLASLLDPARIFWVKAAQAFLLYLSFGLAAFRGELPRRARL